jgi:large subunit ribosomal protein L10
MAKVELKQPIVDEIKAQLDGAKSMVVVDYRGISVADVTELRKQCREAGVVYKVYKNTMVKRAGKVYIQAGGGIVADSVIDNEFAETVNKAGACMKALRETAKE